MLGRVKINRMMDSHSHFGKRIPASLNLFNVQKAQLHQTLQNHVRRRKLLTQLTQADLIGGSDKIKDLTLSRTLRLLFTKS